ncbi:MAG: aquaporin [Methanomassiliicoccaceae archaeon]|jgi:glycerol uptake facilitator-like aquaporin|nr:aquaporin [Methanomassiliicoccaceae archaeon]
MTFEGMTFEPSLSRKLVAEILGTMGLVIAVIGSVMLVSNVQFFDFPPFLLAGLAGGFVLFAMIEAFGKISGGHFNPAISLAMIVSRDMDAKTGVMYMAAQITGGLLAAVLVLVTFIDPAVGLDVTIGSGYPDNLVYLAISEFLCVFMLVSVVFCCVRSGSKKTSLAVGATVGGMIMCTASTFYANPAIDIGRILTNGADKISPITSGVFIIAAVAAAIVAALLLSWLYPKNDSA